MGVSLTTIPLSLKNLRALSGVCETGIATETVKFSLRSFFTKAPLNCTKVSVKAAIIKILLLKTTSF